MSSELNAFVEGKHINMDLDNHPQIIKTNKLTKVTNMSLNLNELNNSDNLEDGHPATPYLRIICLVLKILHVLNPNTPIYETQIWRDCFLNTENNRPKL